MNSPNTFVCLKNKIWDEAEERQMIFHEYELRFPATASDEQVGILKLRVTALALWLGAVVTLSLVH